MKQIKRTKDSAEGHSNTRRIGRREGTSQGHRERVVSEVGKPRVQGPRSTSGMLSKWEEWSAVPDGAHRSSKMRTEN